MRSHAPCNAALTALAASIAVCVLPDAARGDWVLGAAAIVRQDDNVGDAQAYGEKISDTIAEARLSLFQVVPLGESYSLAAGGDFAGEEYHQLAGLRNATLDGAIALKRKWGLGAFAPWARLELSLGRSDYGDGYRDATIYAASLEFGKRIDERWNLSARYEFDRRRASPGENDVPGVPGDAFSQTGQTVSANVEYSVSERIVARAGALLRHGDIVSTTSHGGYLYRSARAIEEDPTFGAAAYAYKIEGTTYGAQLALEYSLTVHSVLGCGVQRLETEAQGGTNYGNLISEITWNYLF